MFQALNFLVAKLLGGHSHRTTAKNPAPKTKKPTRQNVEPPEAEGYFNPPCCNSDPVAQLENFKEMASVLQSEKEGEDDGGADIDDDFVDNLPVDFKANGVAADDDDQDDNEELGSMKKEDENRKLVKMGVNTALAIGLHNFPEGLATFVATLDDPKVGSVLALAIAIHNIPEGLCVALPIFYATGNRMNAFMWALLSGASEFVAALLGWAILANSFSDNTYALLFGMVAGMMVIISIRELLPTAHFYDPEDTVVTFTFIGGMALMAFSLVLFQL